MDHKTQLQIRAAGITQAVISSGAKPDLWKDRIEYGLRLSQYFAERLANTKPAPRAPALKENI